MKIAIVGTAEFSRVDAPYNDKSYEIWGQGFWSPEVKRFDRWFEVHDLDIPLLGSGNGKTGHEQNDNILTESPFAGSGKPIYIQRPHPAIPNGVVYPIEEMLLLFGVRHATSTTAFMMMMAIKMLRPTLSRTEKPRDRLGLWGIEMIESEEYRLQRAGVEHFLGMCVTLNIPVTLPDGCDLRATAKIYAYEKETGKEKKLRLFREDSQAKLARLEDQGEALNKKISFHHGVHRALDILGRGQVNG